MEHIQPSHRIRAVICWSLATLGMACSVLLTFHTGQEERTDVLRAQPTQTVVNDPGWD